MKALTSSFTTTKKFIFSLFITLICIVFTLFCSENLQNIAASLGILSFGILHGANDIKILSNKKMKINSLFGVSFLLIYLIVVFLGILLFYFIPDIALLSFVAVSCYHFGEQHWEGKLKNKQRPLLFYMTYGSLIFLMLFSFHYSQVEEIIFQISSFHIPSEFFYVSLIIIGNIFLIYVFVKVKNIKDILPEALLLGILALLFYTGSLLFGFGLYFIIWHSLPSLKSQIKYLYSENENSPYLKYFKSAFLYWILALTGLVIMYFFGTLPKDQYLSVFFSFLAAITFPHVIVMGLMFHSPNQNSN